jgi:hypothetical protein
LFSRCAPARCARCHRETGGPGRDTAEAQDDDDGHGDGTAEERIGHGYQSARPDGEIVR